MRSARGWLDAVHAALFPKRCAACGARGTYLCPDCENKIPLGRHFSDTAAVFAAPYGDAAVRRLIWLLKFRGVTEVGDIFARWMYEMLIEELADLRTWREQAGKIYLVPVPLSAKRQRQRGFNQAEEIARRLAAIDPRTFRVEADILRKIRHTDTQVHKDRTARLSNLKGAFGLDRGARLRGRTIILLDDVTTTGTTLTEAAAALRRARPRRIIKLAVAG